MIFYNNFGWIKKAKILKLKSVKYHVWWLELIGKEMDGPFVVVIFSSIKWTFMAKETENEQVKYVTNILIQFFGFISPD